MTAQDDPYVRVYYRIIDDPKFADIYDDKAALGTWLTLLIHADALYPAPATLPHGVRLAIVKRLADAGIIDLRGHRYRIHGLAAEREKRTEAARFAADAKHHGHAEAQRRASERHAIRRASALRAQFEPDADALPLRSEPLRSDPSLSSPRLSDAPREKHGSKNETDEERLARYMALRDDESKSADIRYAAKDEVKRIAARLQVRVN